MLIDTERLSCEEAGNGLALHPLTATVPHFWVLPEVNVLGKVKNVRADFESYSEQLTMKIGMLFSVLKLFLQIARQSSCVMPASFSGPELQIVKNKIKKLKSLEF